MATYDLTYGGQVIGKIEFPDGTPKEIVDKGISDAEQAYATQQEFSPLNVVRNLDRSIIGVAEQTLEAIKNPRQTAEFAGGLIEAGMERLNPFVEQEDYRFQQYPQAILNSFKRAYGTPEKALGTLQENPAQMVLDAAIPVTGAAGITRATSAAVPKALPRQLYGTAAKFPIKGPDPIGRQRQLTDTAVSQQIPLSRRGIFKLNQTLGNLNNQINDLISSTDKTASRRAIYQELSELRADLTQSAGAPANLRAFENIVRDLDELLKQGPDRLTPQRLQDFKTKTTAEIDWFETPKTASTRTQEALARGARKKLEEMIPGYAEVNRQQAPLRQLREELPAAVTRTEAAPLVSWPAAGMAGLGGYLGNIPGAIGGMAAGALTNPRVLSGTALNLERLRKANPAFTRIDPSAAAMALMLGQSGRLTEVP